VRSAGTEPANVPTHKIAAALTALHGRGVRQQTPPLATIAIVSDSTDVSEYQFRRGQHVTVEEDGQQFDAVFVRQAEPQDGIDPDAVPRGDIRTVGWVQRSGSDEIEGYLCSEIKSKPDPDVRIAIGKAYEVMQEERRVATGAFAEDVRVSLGVSVDLEITEYQPGRRGLGPVEWTAIFIGTTVATNLINNLVDDLYAKAKQLLLDRKAQGGRPNKGL
jgi:hypothetical protein